jgi:hypothetical protein
MPSPEQEKENTKLSVLKTIDFLMSKLESNISDIKSDLLEEREYYANPIHESCSRYEDFVLEELEKSCLTAEAHFHNLELLRKFWEEDF